MGDCLWTVQLRGGVWKRQAMRVPFVAQWKWIRLVSMRIGVRSLALIIGLGIWHCRELWCRSQMRQLRSSVAVAVASASSCSSDSTPSLGTSMCRGCGPRKNEKKGIPKASQSTFRVEPCPLLSPNSRSAKLLVRGLSVLDSLTVTRSGHGFGHQEWLKSQLLGGSAFRGQCPTPGPKSQVFSKLNFNDKRSEGLLFRHLCIMSCTNIFLINHLWG